MDLAAVDRGQALFSGDAACSTCHTGALMTNNQTLDVGTGGRFQVPSLIGVSYRTPLMHNGECPTIRAPQTSRAAEASTTATRRISRPATWTTWSRS